MALIGGRERVLPASAPLHELVRQRLRRYLSRINTEVVLNRSCARCGIQAPELGSEHFPAFLRAVEPTLQLYLNLSESRALLAELRTAVGPRAAEQGTTAPRVDPRSTAPGQPTRKAWGVSDGRARSSPRPVADGQGEVVVAIGSDLDVEHARSTALELAKRSGLGQVGAVKLATVVSELSRNIAMYAGKGTVTLKAVVSPRAGVEVLAEDRGPGIEDLDHVLSGSYRSRTGLGLGLRGSQRLMDRFEVRTSAALGTTVTAIKYA